MCREVCFGPGQGRMRSEGGWLDGRLEVTHNLHVGSDSTLGGGGSRAGPPLTWLGRKVWWCM